MGKEHIQIPFVRHLKDYNKLKSVGFDAGLVEGQEVLASAVGQELLKLMRVNGHTKLVFLSSPMKRSLESAALISSSIYSIDPNQLVEISIVDGLTTLDHGTLIIPDGYTDGDKFLGLQIAKEIVKLESLPPVSNFSYRYGDPVIKNDGTYKYPDLANFFKEPGESYKAFFIRIFTTLLETADLVEKSKGSQIVFFTHNLVSFFIKDVFSVLSKFNIQKSVRHFDITRACLSHFYSIENKTTRSLERDIYGRIDMVSFSQLSERTKQLLIEEVRALGQLDL